MGIVETAYKKTIRGDVREGLSWVSRQLEKSYIESVPSSQFGVVVHRIFMPTDLVIAF